MRVIWILFLHFLTVSSYNILVIVSHFGRSHQRCFVPLVRKLASSGHKLTVIGYQSFKIDTNIHTEIILEDEDGEGEHFYDLDLFNNVPPRLLTLGSPVVLKKMGEKSCKRMFTNTKIRNLLKSNIKYDIVIDEIFNSECSLVFAEEFQAPIVTVFSAPLMSWHASRFAQPINPSYISNSQLWYDKDLNFFNRVENFIFTIWCEIMHWFIVKSSENLAEQYLNKKFSSFYDIMNNRTSMMLVNSHFSLNFAKPLVPGMVEVGGIHITEPEKLPENIEKFINESTHGVIYFSLGSMIKGHTFPQEKREEFLKAFARLPQRVLWKWENETMPEKPDNVMIQKWMPQFDILSHPNVKAFISHGGLLGTTEAVHCGVPMLVMPQYGDQHTNAKAIEANGGGVILYLREATEEKVYQSLKTILDPKFREGAKALSERFRDRPMSPMDTAIYWVEYVARHKGAPHMRTAAVDMPLVQYLLLDVIAFLLAVILISVYVTYKISCLILRSLFSKKKVKRS